MATLVTLVVAATALFGQTDALPMPDYAMKQFHRLNGDWVVEGKGPKGELKGKWSSRPSPSGDFCRVMESTWELPEAGTIRSFSIAGWDSDTNEIVEVSFDSAGNNLTQRYKVGPDTADTWEGTRRGILLGQKITSKIRVTIKDNEFTWRAYDRIVDGEKEDDVTADFRKVK